MEGFQDFGVIESHGGEGDNEVENCVDYHLMKVDSWFKEMNKIESTIFLTKRSVTLS